MVQVNTVNQQTCIKCSSCIDVCPNKIIEMGQASEVIFNSNKQSLCVKCGHCMAICPTKSIKIADLSYEENFIKLPETLVDENSFFDFLSTRRSIRLFQDKPVPRELLEKIINAVSMAPMGFPPHKTEITVAQNKSVINEALKYMIKSYQDLEKGMKNPMIRSIIRFSVNRETFNSIKNHVLPIMKIGLPYMEKTRDDIITRGAPAMLIFHANKTAESHTEDLYICLAYGLLAAHSLGLGATAIGLVPPVIERNKSLRKMFQIPSKNEVLAAMVVGYPKHSFKRGIRRELRNVSWI